MRESIRLRLVFLQRSLTAIFRLILLRLGRHAGSEEEALSAEPTDGEFMIETPEQRTARRARLAWLKEFLTASVLGTG